MPDGKLGLLPIAGLKSWSWREPVPVRRIRGVRASVERPDHPRGVDHASNSR
jgi:hypothetical protein